MTDLATLAFAVDSSQVNSATQNLNALAMASDTTSQKVSFLALQTAALTSAWGDFKRQQDLLAPAINLTAESLDLLLGKLDVARQQMLGGTGSFAAFQIAAAQVESLGKAFGQTSSSIEDYARKSAELNMTSDQTVRSLQRITEALLNNTVAGVQARQALSDLGVNIGSDPSTASSVMQSAVKALSNFRDDPYKYQIAQTAFGGLSPDEYARLNIPDYVPLAEQQRRKLSDTYSNTIADQTRNSAIQDTTVSRFNSQYADLSSRWNVGGLFGLSSSDRTDLGQMAGGAAASQPDSYQGRMQMMKYLQDNQGIPFAAAGFADGAKTTSASIGDWWKGSSVGQMASYWSQPGAVAASMQAVGAQYNTDRMNTPDMTWSMAGIKNYIGDSASAFGNAASAMISPFQGEQTADWRQAMMPQDSQQFTDAIALQKQLQETMSQGGAKVEEVSTYYRTFNSLIESGTTAAVSEKRAQEAVNVVLEDRKTKMADLIDQAQRAAAAAGDRATLVNQSGSNPAARAAAGLNFDLGTQLDNMVRSGQLTGTGMTAYASAQRSQAGTAAISDVQGGVASLENELKLRQQILGVSTEQQGVMDKLKSDQQVDLQYANDLAKAMFAGPDQVAKVEALIAKVKELRGEIMQTGNVSVNVQLGQGLQDGTSRGMDLIGMANPADRQAAQSIFGMIPQSTWQQAGGIKPADIMTGIVGVLHGDPSLKALADKSGTDSILGSQYDAIQKAVSAYYENNRLGGVTAADSAYLGGDSISLQMSALLAGASPQAASLAGVGLTPAGTLPGSAGAVQAGAARRSAMLGLVQSPVQGIFGGIYSGNQSLAGINAQRSALQSGGIGAQDTLGVVGEISAFSSQLDALDKLVPKVGALHDAIQKARDALQQYGDTSKATIGAREGLAWTQQSNQIGLQMAGVQANMDAGVFASPDQLLRVGATAQANAYLSQNQQGVRDGTIDPNSVMQRYLDQANQGIMKRNLDDMRAGFDAMGSAAANAFDQALTGANSFQQILYTLGRTLETDIIHTLVTQPISKAVSNSLGDTLTGITGGGGASGGGGLASGLGSAISGFSLSKMFTGIGSFLGFGAANGQFVQNGYMQMMAGGSIIDRPTLFPMANGGTALAGEADTEVILPIKRDASGNLGVRSGGGGSGINLSINAPITVNGGQSSSGRMDPGALADMQRQLSDAVQTSVIAVIANEKRPGGSLYN